MDAIFYVLRTGMPWRDLPERYGPYTTAYNRFNVSGVLTAPFIGNGDRRE
jgi:transposase